MSAPKLAWYLRLGAGKSLTDSLIVTLFDVDRSTYGRFSPFPLVSSSVLPSVVRGHEQRENKTKSLEGQVNRGTFGKLRTFNRGEPAGQFSKCLTSIYQNCYLQKRSGQRQALSQSVKHTQTCCPLTLVRGTSTLPTHYQRDIGVTRCDNTNTREVSRRVMFVSRDSEEDCPADDTKAENGGSGETTSLTPIGKGSENEHEYKGDGVRRNGE